ncbi:MAG: YebC/PmpR family DNA-binding transcriptional regulator [Candidatus Kerfeldbacteria bacterium]|nr:YebC/PmpR family DNA-binding transcriptional regulator [Candidatus Kerfeldbacteria bacterium]
MSGHSKWSTIKRHKGAADARRSSMFTKLGHAIAIAARAGADPDTNARLRLAIDRARTENMTKETIERAIQRGSGGGDGAALEEVTYEAFAPGGVAVYVTALTDNRNRTTADVRAALNRYGGNLASAGSVSWMFELKGRLYVDRAQLPTLPEELELALIDAGADDVAASADGTIITCPPTALEELRQFLTARGIALADAQPEFVPKNVVSPPADATAKLNQLEAALEALDDVQQVATNASDDTT